jgi:nucleoside-diphosphate-sugar epimerase
MRIFITGASGCIGHYFTEALIEETEHELFLLLRNPAKLKLDCSVRPGIHLLQGNLRQIDQFSDLLKTVDVLIHAATNWGSIEEDVTKTVELMELLDPEKCQQVIYFSTASILDRQNNLLPEAGELGTDYIRCKYTCYQRLSELTIAPKITKVFPTFVVGGDGNKPYSHLSAGLPDVIKWLDLIRWFKADGSFHFIHAKDIAQVVCYLVDNPPAISEERNFVLGNPKMTVDETVEAFCQYLNKPIYFRIPLSLNLANFFIKLFRLKMQDWDKFSLQYRHFIHAKTVTPATFGLTNYCTSVADILKLRGIHHRY